LVLGRESDGYMILSLPRVVEAAGMSLFLGEEKVVGFCVVGAGVAEWVVL